MTDDLFTPPDAFPRFASGPAPEEISPDASGAFSSDTPFEGGDERCPACGLEPCGCGLEVIPIDDTIPIYDADPFSVLEQVAAIIAATPAAPAERLAAWRSPAIAAFLDRRDALQAKHGERAVTDRSRPLALIAHDLRERASAIEDRLSGRVGPEQERLALATLETLGALALALHERLSAGSEKPALGGEEGGLDADAAGGEAASRAITADESCGSQP